MSEVLNTVAEATLIGKVESPRSLNKLTIIQGALATEASIEKVVRGEKINGKKYEFGEQLIKYLHKKLIFYAPGFAGQYRTADDVVEISDYRPAKAKDLPILMYKFGQWLNKETTIIKNEIDNNNGGDEAQEEHLKDALRIATATHYGLSHLLHPFNDGNGRVARILTNGILMLGTKELKSYGIAIPPVPRLRDYVDEDEMRAKILAGKTVKMDPYIKAIREIYETMSLTPFEVYIASRWAINTRLLLGEIKLEIGEGKTEGDKNLIKKLEWRFSVLEKYVQERIHGNVFDPIPNYFVLEHIAA